MKFATPNTLHAQAKRIIKDMNFVLDHNAFTRADLELFDDHVRVVHEGSLNYDTFSRLRDPIGIMLGKEMAKINRALIVARSKREKENITALTRAQNETLKEFVANAKEVAKSTSADLIKKNRKLADTVEVEQRGKRFVVRITQKINHTSLPAREVSTLVALRESIKRGEDSRKLTKLVERSWFKLKH